MKRRELAQASLTFLDPLPQILIDDTQLWHVRDNQSGLFIEARDSLSGIRVLDIGQPIPDQTADIQLVVQDAGAASPVAVDRGRSPGLAGRAGHLPLVERMRDRFG